MRLPTWRLARLRPATDQRLLGEPDRQASPIAKRRVHSPANWSPDAFAGEYDGVPWNDVWLGLKRFRSASITIAGIELMHRIRKGQFKLGKLRIQDNRAPAVWNAVLAA